MNVSATLNDEVVTIINVDGNGNTAYITYINSSGELRMTNAVWGMGGGGEDSLYIASAATII